MRLAAALILTLMAGGALAQERYGIRYSEHTDTSSNDSQQVQVTPWTDGQIRGNYSEHSVGYEAGADIDGNDYLNVNASGNDESPPIFSRHWGDPHENLNGK